MLDVRKRQGRMIDQRNMIMENWLFFLSVRNDFEDIKGKRISGRNWERIEDWDCMIAQQDFLWF